MSDNQDIKIPRELSNIRALKSAFLQKELDKIGFKMIAPSHGAILYFLLCEGEMTMTELASTISKDRSTVTALVSKLIKLGMVEYIKNPDDKRSKKVHITNNGMIYKNELIQISNRLNEKLFNNISYKEKEIFTKVLLKIKDNLIKK